MWIIQSESEAEILKELVLTLKWSDSGSKIDLKANMNILRALVINRRSKLLRRRRQ